MVDPDVQVVATAIPECTDPDDVSVTVKAFIQANLPMELLELLEKIIMEPSPFSDNRSLQNLLLLTAINSDKGKVVGYINKLQNYDPSEIAKIAIDKGLHEEAFTIYKKYEQHAQAINVLVEHIVSIDRGSDYANRVNKPEVWSRLAKAQLDVMRIKDSVGTWVSMKCSVLCSSITQTLISRLRTHPISPRSSKLRTMRISMTTLYAISKWRARLSANPRSILSWLTLTPRLTDCTIWKTFWA